MDFNLDTTYGYNNDGFIILNLSVCSSLVLVKFLCIFCSSLKIKLSVNFYLIKMDFILDTTYGYNNDIHKNTITKYKPNNLATMNTINTNINIILNREENQLNLSDSYLEIEFVVSDDAGGVFANDANIRLVNYGMMALFSSIKLETTGGRTIDYIDHCHPNLLMYKLLTSTDNEYESGFVRNQGNRDSQLKGDHIAAQRGHMYMMIKMSDLFDFVNDLEKIIYGLGFKLILKRKNNDRALYRVNANPGAVANEGNIEI